MKSGSLRTFGTEHVSHSRSLEGAALGAVGHDANKKQFSSSGDLQSRRVTGTPITNLAAFRGVTRIAADAVLETRAWRWTSAELGGSCT